MIDVVACFVHKIPSFIKLDQVVRKLVYEGTGKAQRFVNVEVKKSSMTDTLAQRWQQLVGYLRSFVEEVPPIGTGPRHHTHALSSTTSSTPLQPSANDPPTTQYTSKEGEEKSHPPLDHH